MLQELFPQQCELKWSLVSKDHWIGSIDNVVDVEFIR